MFVVCCSLCRSRIAGAHDIPQTAEGQDVSVSARKFSALDTRTNKSPPASAARRRSSIPRSPMAAAVNRCAGHRPQRADDARSFGEHHPADSGLTEGRYARGPRAPWELHGRELRHRSRRFMLISGHPKRNRSCCWPARRVAGSTSRSEALSCKGLDTHRVQPARRLSPPPQRSDGCLVKTVGGTCAICGARATCGDERWTRLR